MGPNHLGLSRMSSNAIIEHVRVSDIGDSNLKLNFQLVAITTFELGYD